MQAKTVVVERHLVASRPSMKEGALNLVSNSKHQEVLKLERLASVDLTNHGWLSKELDT